jgi:hypothetical protein
MSGWNYRVLAHKETDGTFFYQIHEVYYDAKGEPNGYTERNVGPVGEDMAALMWAHKKIEAAFVKPILMAGRHFPKELDLSSKTICLTCSLENGAHKMSCKNPKVVPYTEMPDNTNP